MHESNPIRYPECKRKTQRFMVANDVCAQDRIVGRITKRHSMFMIDSVGTRIGVPRKYLANCRISREHFRGERRGQIIESALWQTTRERIERHRLTQHVTYVAVAHDQGITPMLRVRRSTATSSTSDNSQERCRDFAGDSKNVVTAIPKIGAGRKFAHDAMPAALNGGVSQPV